MPQLVDVSLRQAEIMLKAKGLELGSVIYKASPYEKCCWSNCTKVVQFHRIQRSLWENL